MDSSIVEKYHAIEVPTVNRSGVMADVSLDDLVLRCISGFCTHPDIQVALYYSGREVDESLSAIIYCPICGYKESPAALLKTPGQRKRTDAEIAIFGESDHRYFMSQRAFARGAARKKVW